MRGRFIQNRERDRQAVSLFFVCVVTLGGNLSLGNSTAGARICAGAAGNTDIGVDGVLFAFADSASGAGVDAGSACNAFVTNYVSHNKKCFRVGL